MSPQERGFILPSGGSNYRGRLSAVGEAATSQAEAAYDAIKTAILRCDIPPRSRLTEAELADRFGVGRAAIRVAMNRLYQEALVDVLPRYGYLVAGEDELDARDLYQLQLILESTSAGLAAGRVDAAGIRMLDQRCIDAKEVRSLKDAEAFLQANTQFHAAVAHSTGNALLSRFVRILFERLERQIFSAQNAVDIVGAVAHSHESLVELLIAGRSAEAENAARQQVAHNQQIIMDAMAGRSRASETNAGEAL